MNRTTRYTSFILAFGILGAGATVSSGALSVQQKGSGYSGKLSSNAAIRKQQLICDPVTVAGSLATAPTEGEPFSALAAGAPRSGSDSVNYDPSTVTLSDVELGSGYAGSGRVEVTSGGRRFLQDIRTFLTSPGGTETGYVQLFYHHGPPDPRLPKDTLFGPAGEPGQTPNAEGFDTNMQAGVAGFDTHSFFFTYKPGVADTTVASYTIFANKGNRGDGGSTDSLTGLKNGKEFTIGADQLQPVTVQGALATVPLPPAVWAGGAMLAGMGLLSLARRRRVVG